MASEILGLFTSPEQYQRQQDLMMQRQAAELAQLDPYQSIRFNAIRAGQQFGQGLSGILGAEDPQLRMITARQSALRGIDLGNPDSIFSAAQQLANAGDQQGALMLADYGRKAAADAALVTQRSREARAAATPKELQIAAASAQLEDQIAQLEATPASPERDRALSVAKNTLARLTTAAKPGQVPDAIEIARELALEAGAPGTEAYNKSYRDNLKKLSTKDSSEKQLEFSRLLQEAGIAPGTPEYQSKMRAYIDAEITGRRQGKGTTVTNVLPGQGKEGAKDIPAFRDKVIGTIDPFRKTVTAADTAITNINDSLKTSNFASFRAAQTQFARAISGAGDLSQKELKAAGADPSLLGGTADYLSTFFTSTPTADTQKKLLSTLKAIRTVAAKKAREEIANQKNIATRAGFNDEDVKLIFNFPEFEQGKAGGGAGKSRTVTLRSGKTVTVVED
jgi:hypothetical protein